MPAGLRLPAEAALDGFAAAFYVFVLAVIVSHMFAARRLRSDDVVGAFSGYILIALIWGRLYALVWMALPGSYRINPDVTWQLGNWHTLHALFDYYSFTTISSIGYADITTTRPASNTLVWLEVMCGQFYLAVVVASIVGMRLAQTLAPPRDGQLTLRRPRSMIGALRSRPSRLALSSSSPRSHCAAAPRSSTCCIWTRENRRHPSRRSSC